MGDQDVCVVPPVTGRKPCLSLPRINQGSTSLLQPSCCWRCQARARLEVEGRLTTGRARVMTDNDGGRGAEPPGGEGELKAPHPRQWSSRADGPWLIP